MTNLQYKKTYTAHDHTLKGMFVHFFLYVHINKGMFVHCFLYVHINKGMFVQYSCGMFTEMFAHVTSFPGHQQQLPVVVMIHRRNH